MAFIFFPENILEFPCKRFHFHHGFHGFHNQFASLEVDCLLFPLIFPIRIFYLNLTPLTFGSGDWVRTEVICN